MKSPKPAASKRDRAAEQTALNFGRVLPVFVCPNVKITELPLNEKELSILRRRQDKIRRNCNYFYGDAPSNLNKLIYEISFFFYMKVPDTFAIDGEGFTESNGKQRLVWVSLDDDIKIYPEFFKTELKQPTDTVKHFTSRSIR